MICLTFEVNLLFHSIFPCFILYDSIANLGRTHLPKATSLFNVTIDSFLISNFFVNEFFLAHFCHVFLSACKIGSCNSYTCKLSEFSSVLRRNKGCLGQVPSHETLLKFHLLFVKQVHDVTKE